MQLTDTTSSLMIECPSCSHRFPLSGAVLTQVKEEVQAELSGEIKKQESALHDRLTALKAEQENFLKRTTELAAKEEALESELSKQLKAREEALTSKLKEQVRESFQVQIKELSESLNEKSSALKSANEKELALIKQQRVLEEAQQSLELKVARQIEEERKAIRDAAIKQAQEENRLNLDEKDRLVDDLKKQMDALRRKAEQGSQQRQGETLELDIEQILRSSYPVDVIEEVPKGIRGADLICKVISPTGRTSGSIVIETKRTKAWSKGWLEKLREDQRLVKADIAVLVSEVTPEGVDQFDFIDGIWVCSPVSFLPLIASLRWSLLQLNILKVAGQNSDEKKEVLYSYIIGNEFRHRVEAVIESFTSLQSDLEKEKRAMERIWASRSKSIEKAVRNTAGMFGDVQTLSKNALEPIDLLELPE